MSNVIEDYIMVDRIQGSTKAKSSVAKVKAASQEFPCIQDTPASEVCLSTHSKQLEALKSIILNASEMSTAKLQFIKEAVAGGSYIIHSDKIAAKLLADTPLA